LIAQRWDTRVSCVSARLNSHTPKTAKQSGNELSSHDREGKA
jgi:hypothetical protein